MQEAPQNTPQPVPVQQMGMKPSRGGTVLTLGILGIVVCFIMGIIAWVMGSGDLREMREGKRDREGEQLTKAGMICGIIGTVLSILGIVWWLIAVVIIGGSGFLGAMNGF